MFDGVLDIVVVGVNEGVNVLVGVIDGVGFDVIVIDGVSDGGKPIVFDGVLDIDIVGVIDGVIDGGKPVVGVTDGVTPIEQTSIVSTRPVESNVNT